MIIIWQHGYNGHRVKKRTLDFTKKICMGTADKLDRNLINKDTYNTILRQLHAYICRSKQIYFTSMKHMDAQIQRHQPLITAWLVFAPKAFPPPPIIAAHMEFPSINVHQQYEHSPSPEIRTPRKHSLAPPKRWHTTPKRASTPQQVPKRNMDVDLETPHMRAASRRPMPINTQRTVAFEDDSPLMPLSDVIVRATCKLRGDKTLERVDSL